MDTKVTQPTPARSLPSPAICISGPRAVRAPVLTTGTTGPGSLKTVASFWGLTKSEAGDGNEGVTETRVLPT